MRMPSSLHSMLNGIQQWSGNPTDLNVCVPVAYHHQRAGYPRFRMSFHPALPAGANELPHVAMAGPHPFAVQGYCLLSSGRTPNAIISLICIGPWIVRGIAASVVGPQARSCIIIWGRLHGRRSISRRRRQRRSGTYDRLNVSLEQTPPGFSTPLLAGRWSDGNRANRQGDCNHRCRKWRWPSMSAEGHNDLPSLVVDVPEVVVDTPCNNT